MVICLERRADLHMAQLMPLPLTISCFSKIQIGFTFLVPAHLGSPRKRAVKRVCVCVYLASKNESPWAIMRLFLRNSTFSRFSRTLICHRLTDRHWAIAYTALA